MLPLGQPPRNQLYEACSFMKWLPLAFQWKGLPNPALLTAEDRTWDPGPGIWLLVISVPQHNKGRLSVFVSTKVQKGANMSDN